VGGVSQINDIPYMQYLLSNKGAKLQQERSKRYEILPKPRDANK
jgi:hypothetical protein